MMGRRSNIKKDSDVTPSKAADWVLWLANQEAVTEDIAAKSFSGDLTTRSDDGADSGADEDEDGDAIVRTFDQRPLVGSPDTSLPPNHVTIFSCSKRERAGLEVPLQKVYKGPRQVLPDDVASIPCSDLSAEGLLERLNYHLGTSYTLDQSRTALLDHCLDEDEDYDFGMAYALLRPRWHMRPRAALDNIHASRDNDEKARQRALDGVIVQEKNIRPRRVWDLWSNRVVPTWMVCTKHDKNGFINELRDRGFFAVSHAWLDAAGRQTVDTPINGHEWPVPIPTTTTLERVRTELLHHTTKDLQYAWLDVLCLRQEGVPENEDLRKEEWTLDIPTIGTIYYGAMSVVYYYSGLGLPFEIGDLKSPRHWLNRAWTLQEIKSDSRSFIAGISPRSPQMPYTRAALEGPIDDSVRDFCAWMNSLPRTDTTHQNLFWVIDAMRGRSATSELDRIAGLNYLSHVGHRGTLPAYVVGDDPENAWRRFVEMLPASSQAEFLFFVPEAGPEKQNAPAWRPLWKQLCDAPFRSLRRFSPNNGINFDKVRNEYWLNARRIECQISGLDQPLDEHDEGDEDDEDDRPGDDDDDCDDYDETDEAEVKSREGKISLKGTNGKWLEFDAIADHSVLIESGQYTLLVAEPTGEQIETSESERIRFVVGHMVKSGKFRKVTVVDVQKNLKLWRRVAKKEGRVVLL